MGDIIKGEPVITMLILGCDNERSDKQLILAKTT